MRFHWLALILLLGAGCAPSFSARTADPFASSAPTSLVSHGVSGALPTPPLVQLVPAMTESARARFLVMLGQGSLRSALEAWEVHTGRAAPRAAWAMQSAFQKANQVAGACIRVARSIHEGFKSLGIQPAIVRFKPPNETEWLGWEMNAGVPQSTIQISNTGIHIAVKVGERVYDAFTGPSGMPLEEYLKRLCAHGGQPVMQLLENLP
jgi:hypothetical protein